MGRYQASAQKRAHRPVNSAVSPSILEGFCSRLAEATGHPGARAAFPTGGSNFEVGGWSSPLDAGGGTFAVDYLWKELLSKFDDGRTSDSKKRVAMEKFRESEVLCGSTNLRLASMVGLPSDLANTDIERTMCLARRKIRQVLGKLDLNHVARGFGFTSGASTRLKRTSSQIAHKYSGQPESTSGNLAFAYAAINHTPAWKAALVNENGIPDVTEVRGNKVTTVPKNYKNERTIAIEPEMNMYVQKGFGSLIRERLRRVGINLNSQQTNQDLALLASSSGLLATIDLKAASDTVSIELVRFLLPPVWVAALEQCRSTTGVLPSGEHVLYRKFSSMGCGFTFELESLIFYALTWACCNFHGASTSLISIYGDDIIAPRSVAPHLLELLEHCGFEHNEDKTFVDGPFRESCGKHYYHGEDVQPFYVKKRPKVLSDLFHLHNNLYRWLERQRRFNVDLVAQVEPVLRWLRGHAPVNWRRPRLPDGYGDGAFIGPFDVVRPNRCHRLKGFEGWEGFICEVLTDSTNLLDFHEDADKAWYGTKEKSYEHVPIPTLVGRLLSSLSALPDAPQTVKRGWGVRKKIDAMIKAEVSGGVSIPRRTRVCKIIVPLDSFALAGCG